VLDEFKRFNSSELSLPLLLLGKKYLGNRPLEEFEELILVLSKFLTNNLQLVLADLSMDYRGVTNDYRPID